MNIHKNFETLKKQAEVILNKNNPSMPVITEVKQLQNQLSLYQTELELQNHDLLQTKTFLEEALNNYSELYDFAPVGYFTLNSTGLIFNVNHIGASLLGFNKNTLYHKCFSRHIAPDYHHIFFEFKQRIFNSSAIQSCELKLLKKNGPLFYAQLEGKVITNARTHMKQLLIVVTDITMQKQTQEQISYHRNQISHMEHFSSVSELTSTIIHELNHPHAVISNYIHGSILRLEKGIYEKNDLLHILKKTLDQLNRANEIILRMKNFICKGTLKFEICNLDSIIKEVLTLINHEIDDCPITVRYQSTPSAIELTLDKVHIQQVLLNLVRNALDAIKDAKVNDPKLTISVNLLNKKTVQISILDNGPGFDSNIEHRLFEPHFTTKAYGIGLGLAISRAIIESHQGKLYAEHNFPYGSCFKFTLPIKTKEENSNFNQS